MPSDFSDSSFAAPTRSSAAFHERGGQPAISYGIVRDGELVHAAGFGSRRSRTQPGIPCPTSGRSSASRRCRSRSPRPRSCCCATRARSRLTTRPRRTCRELAGWVNGAADAGPLTIRHLLTMTAGFPTDDPWGDRQQGLPLDEFRALLARGVSFNWAPGTRFEYSNLGYAILGLSRGGRVRRCRTTSSSGPGCSRPSAWRGPGSPRKSSPAADLAIGYRRGAGGWQELPFDPYGAFAPMGGVFSCVADLATWSAGFAAAFPPDGPASLGNTGSLAAHPLAAAVAAADAAAAGGDRVARAGPDSRRPARRAVVLRLRAVRRRGPRARPGGEPQRRLPGLRVQHAVAPGDRARRHRARQRHLLGHVTPWPSWCSGRCLLRSAAYHVALAPAPGAAMPAAAWPPTVAAADAVNAPAQRLGRRGGGRAVQRERGARPALPGAAGRPGAAPDEDRRVRRRRRPSRRNPTRPRTAAGGSRASGPRSR